MFLGIQMLELGSTDSSEGLVVSVDGFLTDGFHGAGLVKDYEVVDRSDSSSGVLHNTISFKVLKQR